MHNFNHGKLPISFAETWITNRTRNPNLELRNADDLYVPGHNYATTKRFPIYNFPKIWNEAENVKFSPSLKGFLKNVKSALVSQTAV